MNIPATAVRPYRSEDKAEVLPLLERVYDAEVRRRHELLWDWWQARPAAGGDAGHGPAVVQRDGRVVGYTGLLRRRFKIGDREAEGGFLIDSFTSPDQRGAGIALLRHLIGSTDLLMGAAQSRFESLWKRMLARDDLTAFRVRKAVRIVDPAAFLPPRLRFARGPARAAAACAEAALGLIAPRLAGGRIERVERFPPEVDDFCRRWAATRINAALRDADYLNWRFADGPLAYEKRLLIAGGRIAGLAAFRPARFKGRRVLLLVEALAAGPGRARIYGSLLREAIRYARSQRLSDVQTFDAGCADLRLAFRRWGFLLRPEYPDIVAKQRSAEGDRDALYQKEDWFLTPGDSDFEFAYFNQSWKNLAGLHA